MAAVALLSTGATVQFPILKSTAVVHGGVYLKLNSNGKGHTLVFQDDAIKSQYITGYIQNALRSAGFEMFSTPKKEERLEMFDPVARMIRRFDLTIFEWDYDLPGEQPQFIRSEAGKYEATLLVRENIDKSKVKAMFKAAYPNLKLKSSGPTMSGHTKLVCPLSEWDGPFMRYSSFVPGPNDNMTYTTWVLPHAGTKETAAGKK